MKSAVQWWPFYGDDFLLDTQHLGPLETGVYVLLLNEYYRTERPLPANQEYLRKICKLDSLPAGIAALRFVIEDFFSATKKGLRHKRADAEISERRKRYNQKRDASIAGVNARRNHAVNQKATERSTERLTQPHIHIQEQEPKIKHTARARFQIPTLEQVSNYCILRNNQVDAAHFCDYYESKGWIVGKSQMRSWQAAVRTWEKNGYTQPATWRKGDGSIPSKAEQRVAKNQQRLVDELGLGEMLRPGSEDLQNGVTARGEPDLAKMLRRGAGGDD